MGKTEDVIFEWYLEYNEGYLIQDLLDRIEDVVKYQLSFWGQLKMNLPFLLFLYGYFACVYLMVMLK